jgi:hypothetical protein
MIRISRLKIVLATVLLFVVSPWACPSACAQPWTGSGEANDPYQIWTAEDMQAIGADANYWDAHFKLMADIDLGSFDGLEGRPAFNLIGYRIGDFHLKPFRGVFDGNDKKITNFTYRNSKRDLVGLFGFFAGEYAQIRNLRLIDPNVIAGTGDYVGSLVGQAGFHEGAPGSGGTIVGCSAEGGRVQGYRYVGGLIGRAEDVTITNCNSSLCVEGDEYIGGLVGRSGPKGFLSNCSSSSSVRGDNGIGGLVGRHSSGEFAPSETISECFSSGNISGYQSIGGLVGVLHVATVRNCYATGSIRGYDYVGGLVGLYESSVILDSYAAGSVHGIIDVGGLVGNDGEGGIGEPFASCFWDNTVNSTLSGLGNKEDPPEVIGESTTNMQTESTFVDAGWRFTTPAIWKMCVQPDYPKLWWETCPEQSIAAAIEITPKTLNLQSKGRWITCLIRLPEDYSVSDIDPNSILLEDEMPADRVWLQDEFAVAKFSRPDLRELLADLETPTTVELLVSGQLNNGTLFEGTDTIRVIDRRRKKPPRTSILRRKP